MTSSASRKVFLIGDFSVAIKQHIIINLRFNCEQYQTCWEVLRQIETGAIPDVIVLRVIANRPEDADFENDIARYGVNIPVIFILAHNPDVRLLSKLEASHLPYLPSCFSPLELERMLVRCLASTRIAV
jgi:DNA-binding NtrC family response regulator